uniref:tRNA-intron lyase n=1 Tax=Timema bartmani TaxID=61472 RepID=A0A7R9HYJ5_9NEOP|nr:unnamed protein product [Timema bartmani]
MADAIRGRKEINYLQSGEGRDSDDTQIYVIQSVNMELKEPKRKRRVHVAARQPFPVQIESVTGIPVSSALWEVYTGIYNGDCVVVEAQEEMDALYNMSSLDKPILGDRSSTASQRRNPQGYKAEELERLKEIASEKGSRIQENEAILKKLRQEQNEKRMIDQTLLTDATKLIKETTEKKDMVGFNMAQLMLEGVEKAMEEEDKTKLHSDAVQKTGFFGKGSLSRSAPVFGKVRQGVPPLVRQRQWLQRQKWAEKQSLMALEFPDSDMMEPHNKRTFLETSELQPDTKRSRLETDKNNSNNSNNSKLQTSLTNNKLGNGLVSSSSSDDSKKVSSSVNLQEINLEKDIITLDSSDNNKSVSKKDIHQKILEAVQSVKNEDRQDISDDQGESLSTQSKTLKQRCNDVDNQHLEIIETDQNKTINNGKKKRGECSEITLLTVHSDNEETKVLDSSVDYNMVGEAISLEDTDIVEVSNLLPDNKAKSFAHQVHSSEGNSRKSIAKNYLTNQEKTLSGKNEDNASEEVEIVVRSSFNPDSTKKPCTQRKEIVVMEESLDKNLFIDPNHSKETTTTQGVPLENALVDDDKQVSKEGSTITKQNISKSSQDIEVVDLKNPETQGCKNKSSTVSTKGDSEHFQQEDVLMTHDSEVSFTNKNNCNFKSKETSNKKHTKSLEQYNVADKVLVVPDSDSEDEDFLDHISPRIEPEVFPIREMLHLTLEEAFFLSYALGCLQVLDLFGNTLTVVDTWGLFSESQKDFVQKYVAYHHFRSKGWVVKPGLKFGGDFWGERQVSPRSELYVGDIKVAALCTWGLDSSAHIKWSGELTYD